METPPLLEEAPNLPQVSHLESSTSATVRIVLGFLVLDYFLRVGFISGFFPELLAPYARLDGNLCSLALFCYLFVQSDKPYRRFGLSWLQKPGSLPLSLGAIAVMALMSAAWSIFEPHSKTLSLNLILTAFAAPITEELMYRSFAFGELSEAFARTSRWPLLITAACFAIGHGFQANNGHTMFGVLPFAYTLFLGLIFGAVRARSGSIIFPIAAHMTLNAANAAFAIWR